MEIPKVVIAEISQETTKEDQREKVKSKNPLLFKAIFTFLLVVALPVLILLASSPRETQDIRSKAGKGSPPSSSRIIYLPFSFSRDKDDDISIKVDKIPEIRNGFIPGSQISGKKEFTAVVLDEKGKEILKTNFAPPDLVAIDGIDSKTSEFRSELKQVAGNAEGIVLLHHPQATYVKIQNPQGEVVNNVSLKNAVDVNNVVYPKEVDEDKLKQDIEKLKEKRKKASKDTNKSSFRHLLNFLSPNSSIFAANGTFNLAIIGDNYSGDNVLFQKDADDIVTGLLSIEPFASNQINISIYAQLSTAQICTPVASWPSISCNDQIALQEASSIPYDKIYVLHNGPYSGYAYVGGTLAYGTSSTDRNLAVKQGLFIHELAGHALGGLMDEYSYGATGVSYAPNCESSPLCSSWSGVTGLGCFTTCGFTNLFRATDNNSVMNIAFFNGVLNFDNYSTQIVQNKLATYLQKSQLGPKLLSEEQILTPTLTPLVSISTPTPTPTLTLAPTSTPTPSNTPTPFPTPTSLFPKATLPPWVTPSLTPNPTYTPTPTATLAPTLTPTFTTPATPATPAPTRTPTLTPFPTPTSPFPTATLPPGVTPSLTPSPTLPETLKSSCLFPNYCTAIKYCESSNVTSFTCGRIDKACCKPIEKIETKEEERTEEKKMNVFVALPTVKVSPPTPTVTPLIFIPPTFSPKERQYIEPPPTLVVATPQLYPTRVVSPQGQAEIPTYFTPIPTQIAARQKEIIPSPFPSPTLFNPQTLELERITPTPLPKSSPFSNLGFLGAIFSGLFKAIFPGLF